MVSVIFAIVLSVVVFLSAVDSQTLTPIVVDTGRNVSTFLNGAYKVSYLFGPTTVDVAITVTTNGWAGASQSMPLLPFFPPFFFFFCVLSLSSLRTAFGIRGGLACPFRGCDGIGGLRFSFIKVNKSEFKASRSF